MKRLKKLAKCAALGLVICMTTIIPMTNPAPAQAFGPAALAGIAIGGAIVAAGTGVNAAEVGSFQPAVTYVPADPATITLAPVIVAYDIVAAPFWLAGNVFAFGVRAVSLNHERPAFNGPQFMWYK